MCTQFKNWKSAIQSNWKSHSKSYFSFWYNRKLARGDSGSFRVRRVFSSLFCFRKLRTLISSVRKVNRNGNRTIKVGNKSNRKNGHEFFRTYHIFGSGVEAAPSVWGGFGSLEDFFQVFDVLNRASQDFYFGQSLTGVVARSTFQKFKSFVHLTKKNPIISQFLLKIRKSC